MESFEDKYSTLQDFKYDLENLIKERSLMESCIEEVIVEIQTGGTAKSALGIIKLYKRLEIVQSYFDEAAVKDE